MFYTKNRLAEIFDCSNRAVTAKETVSTCNRKVVQIKPPLNGWDSEHILLVLIISTSISPVIQPGFRKLSEIEKSTNTLSVSFQKVTIVRNLNLPTYQEERELRLNISLSLESGLSLENLFFFFLFFKRNREK